jgi:hypothetical protein
VLLLVRFDSEDLEGLAGTVIAFYAVVQRIVRLTLARMTPIGPDQI